MNSYWQTLVTNSEGGSSINPPHLSPFLRQLMVEGLRLDDNTLSLSWHELGLSDITPSTAIGKSGRTFVPESQVLEQGHYYQQQKHDTVDAHQNPHRTLPSYEETLLQQKNTLKHLSVNQEQQITKHKQSEHLFTYIDNDKDNSGRVHTEQQANKIRDDFGKNASKGKSQIIGNTPNKVGIYAQGQGTSQSELGAPSSDAMVYAWGQKMSSEIQLDLAKLTQLKALESEVAARIDQRQAQLDSLQQKEQLKKLELIALQDQTNSSNDNNQTPFYDQQDKWHDNKVSDSTSAEIGPTIGLIGQAESNAFIDKVSHRNLKTAKFSTEETFQLLQRVLLQMVGTSIGPDKNIKPILKNIAKGMNYSLSTLLDYTSSNIANEKSDVDARNMLPTQEPSTNTLTWCNVPDERLRAYLMAAFKDGLEEASNNLPNDSKNSLLALEKNFIKDVSEQKLVNLLITMRAKTQVASSIVQPSPLNSLDNLLSGKNIYSKINKVAQAVSRANLLSTIPEMALSNGFSSESWLKMLAVLIKPSILPIMTETKYIQAIQNSVMQGIEQLNETNLLNPYNTESPTMVGARHIKELIKIASVMADSAHTKQEQLSGLSKSLLSNYLKPTNVTSPLNLAQKVSMDFDELTKKPNVKNQLSIKENEDIKQQLNRSQNRIKVDYQNFYSKQNATEQTKLKFYNTPLAPEQLASTSEATQREKSNKKTADFKRVSPFYNSVNQLINSQNYHNVITPNYDQIDQAKSYKFDIDTSITPVADKEDSFTLYNDNTSALTKASKVQLKIGRITYNSPSQLQALVPAKKRPKPKLSLTEYNQRLRKVNE
jgi:hypothetical protein